LCCVVEEGGEDWDEGPVLSVPCSVEVEGEAFKESWPVSKNCDSPHPSLLLLLVLLLLLLVLWSAEQLLPLLVLSYLLSILPTSLLLLLVLLLLLPRLLLSVLSLVLMLGCLDVGGAREEAPMRRHKQAAIARLSTAMAEGMLAAESPTICICVRVHVCVHVCV
jgi:hypothetical protein